MLVSVGLFVCWLVGWFVCYVNIDCKCASLGPAGGTQESVHSRENMSKVSRGARVDSQEDVGSACSPSNLLQRLSR